MYFRLLLLCIGLGQLNYGQSAQLKKAKKLFLDRAYISAASILENYASDQESFTMLADCYYFNGMMNKASKTYLKAAQSKQSTLLSDAVNFRYAHALYGNNNTELADSIMRKITSKPINTKRYITLLEEGVPYLYELEKIKSGNRPGDFGMNYFGEDIVFASSREASSKTYTWNEKPYLNLFTGQLTKANTIVNVSALSPLINSKKHESNAIISADGKTLYFSRTNGKRHDINGVKVATVKLYQSNLNGDNTWSTPKELPFCSDLYSTQHPALDEKMQRLYFSSDMPNGYGSFDIYYVEIKDDSYGTPVNLGTGINTKHREQFPYYSTENILYFASDGHQGLGGLDVFMAQKNTEDWDTPLNLGATLNSNVDDFSFVVDVENDTGFLSSNRDGSDNMYVFKREENLRTFIVEGSVRDKNSKILLPNTMITLFDNNDRPIDSMKVSENGRYIFKTRPDSKYKIEGFKPLYIPTEVTFNTDDSGRIELDIELVLESYDDAEDIITEKEDGYVYIELENIYFDLDKWVIKPQAANTLNVLVDLMKKYPRMEIELGAHTDNRSSEDYNLKLSNNRAKAATAYLIENGIDSQRLKAIGYGESQLLVNCGDSCSENEHAVNRRCEFIITK